MQEGLSEREIKWFTERASRFTSSSVLKLFAKGKGKVKFGKTAIDYIDDIVYQIESGNLIDEIKAYALQWGNDNEPNAISWLQDNYAGMYEVKSCTYDFDEIVFRKALGDAFGDSLDGLVYDGDKEIAWVEIKCPVNSKKAWQLTNKPYTKADVVDEYKYQLACHFIGSPHLDKGWYVVYDGHEDKDGVSRDKAKVWEFERHEFTGLIKEIEARIEMCYKFVLLCVKGIYKPEEINEWWDVQEFKAE